MNCVLCGKIIERNCDFCRHIVKTHKITVKDYFDKYIEPYPHKCPYCNAERKFIHFSYLKTCCSKYCEFKRKSEYNGAKTVTCIEKIKETKKLKYGDEKYNNRTKAKLTTLSHYGVEIPAKCDEILNKIQQTNLDNFGTKFPLQNTKIKEKQQNTCLLKYGARNISKTKIFKENIKKIMLSKYGVEHYSQTSDFAHKVRKKYNYNSINFDSLAEIEVYKFCIKNNLSVEYQPCSFKYTDSLGKTHLYFPDFRINGKLYEIKGGHLWKDDKIWFPYRNTLTEEQLNAIDARDLAKTECMKMNDITVILSTDIDKLDKIIKL